MFAVDNCYDSFARGNLAFLFLMKRVKSLFCLVFLIDFKLEYYCYRNFHPQITKGN